MRVPFAGPRLALKILVDAGHDAEQRRLARAVGAEDADLRAGIEGQPDAARISRLRRDDLAQVLHDIDELGSHERSFETGGAWGAERPRSVSNVMSTAGSPAALDDMVWELTSKVGSWKP